jgi:hypothetical protein
MMGAPNWQNISYNTPTTTTGSFEVKGFAHEYLEK